MWTSLKEIELLLQTYMKFVFIDFKLRAVFQVQESSIPGLKKKKKIYYFKYLALTDFDFPPGLLKWHIPKTNEACTLC